MHKIKAGEQVEITTKDNSYKGLVMPSTNDETVFLRLSSGYQIGILKKNIDSVKLIESEKNQKKEIIEEHKPHKKDMKSDAKFNAKLPIISILHTGGTFASKIDYKTGAVTPRFSPDELIGMFPELQQIANIKSRLVRNMFSENMRFQHYNLLAKEIKAEIESGVDAVIVTHGTDTLHYSAAALSFAIEHLTVPVILVGSQRSSDRGSTDASLNLINAAYFAAHTQAAGVFICMHASSNDDYCAIIPGTRARKMPTSRRDAFKAINSIPLAMVDYNKKEINSLMKEYEKKDVNRKIELKLFNEKLKIGMLYQHTHMYAEQFSFFDDYDGVVILATGLGNLPIIENDEFTAENTKITKALQHLVKKGVVIALAQETIYGRIILTVYEPQRTLLQIGVLGNECDMTPETAFIKLAWLLSNYKKEDVKTLYSKNLRGELSERLSYETYDE